MHFVLKMMKDGHFICGLKSAVFVHTLIKMPLEKKLAAKDLLIGAVGVSPVPIAGEICLSYFFYKILENTNIKFAAIPAALLTRLGMYQQFYFPIYEKAKDLF